MTRPLSPDSPRRLAAARFGAELRKAMTARGIGTKTLAPQARVAPSGIAGYRLGQNLPTIEVATRLAQSLEWPVLRDLAKNGRESACRACGRKVVTEGGRPRLYCSSECQWVASKKAVGRQSPGVALVESVEAELQRVRDWGGTVKRSTLAAAAEAFHRDSAKGRRVWDLSEKKWADRQAAIDAMCADCEPEGMCQTPECPLRAYSPLPLSKRHLTVDAAQPAEGVHGPTHRAKWLESMQAAAARRWTPEERERQAAESRRRWAETDLADRVREGVRKRDERRRQPA